MVDFVEEILEKINNSLFSVTIVKKEYDINKNIQLWLDLENKKDIFLLAGVVKYFNGRCITINLEKQSLLYHFDIKNILISVRIELDNNEIDSIALLLKSADWVEKELRDIYGIKFYNKPLSEQVFFEEKIHKTDLEKYMPLSQIMLGNLLDGVK